MKNLIKKLYMKIFKRRQYRESLEIMNKLLGIEKIGERIDVFHYWFFDYSRVISLINYKNVWNKPKFSIKLMNINEYFVDFELHINTGYYNLSYAKLKNFKE